MANTRPARAKSSTPRRRTTTSRVDPDQEVDALGQQDPAQEREERRTRRMTTEARQKAELSAALDAKRTGAPVFPCPPELPEAHRPYWSELVNSRPHDYFNRGDIPLLKLYCRAAYDIDLLDRQIEAEGCVIPNARGNPVVNPKVVVRSIAESRLMTLSVKLRAQPASRYDSANDKKQSEKVKKATAAAETLIGSASGIDDDDGALLAGGGLAH